MKKDAIMEQDTTADVQAKTVKELEAERDAALENYAKLTRAHDKLKEDLKEYKTKSSTNEELQKQFDELVAEKTKLASDFDAFKSEIKQEKTKQLLVDKLTEAGAKSTATALKLIDMDAITFDDQGNVVENSVKGAIDALKAEHDIIFSSGETNKPAAPAVKHAVDTVTKSAYETEMAAAVKSGSQKQLDEVFAKYQGTKR